ncbi:MAG: FGGY-family carbohydrate kinase [Actinomycetota bacterium]|nr:FGGY-family carbohydrate kinase [Actinomycetota bacterium]
MKVKRYVSAVDLGASSGRVFAVSFDGDRVELEIASRFSNGAISMGGGQFWDIGNLYKGVKEGIVRSGEIARVSNSGLSSVAVDSWAVDYGFVVEHGPMLGLPHHHRDNRTIFSQDNFFKRWEPFDLYTRSGIALHRFNTLYQLLAEEPLLYGLEPLRALLIPDLISFFLTNEIATEATNFSTTQLMMTSGEIDEVLLGEVGASKDLFGSIVEETSLRGLLTEQVALELGLDRLPVYTVASHDTASAVLAVPFGLSSSSNYGSESLSKRHNSAYISSGTWSLVGVELLKPIISKEAFTLGFTNELGAFGRYRFLKNVMGLWMLSEVLRDLSIDLSTTAYETLIQRAAEVVPFRALIDATSEEFLGVGSMARRITEDAKRNGFKAPELAQEFARCIFDSLAIAYAKAIAEIEELTGQEIESIHIVGGGSQNWLLSQLTADATGKPVLSGPVEAAALGNGLMQLISLGDLPRDLDVVRAVVADSVEVSTYYPDADNHQRFRYFIDHT